MHRPGQSETSQWLLTANIGPTVSRKPCLMAGLFHWEFTIVVGGNLAISVAGSIEGFAVREYRTHGSTDVLFGSQGGIIAPIAGFLSV